LLFIEKRTQEFIINTTAVIDADGKYLAVSQNAYSG
jgi:hypothetical protein